MEWYVRTKAPAVLGHEPAGVVTVVGEGVDGFQIGDRVFVHHHVPCFVCHECQRGHHTLCATFKATHIEPGGFSEYIRVPALNVERDVLKLPAAMSFERATMIEPLATCIRSVTRAQIQPADTVIVLGAGITGLMHIQLARLFGAGLVVATDVVPYKLEMARRLGANLALDARDDVLGALKDANAGRGADAVFVTPGKREVMEQGLTLAGKGATVMLFAPTAPDDRLSIHPFDVLFSEITITGTYSCSALETRQSLTFIQNGRVKVDELITHRFDLAGVGEALRLAARAGESLKVLIVP
jgi:L-iditol 2-dehydrogenase